MRFAGVQDFTNCGKDVYCDRSEVCLVCFQRRIWPSGEMHMRKKRRMRQDFSNTSWSAFLSWPSAPRTIQNVMGRQEKEEANGQERLTLKMKHSTILSQSTNVDFSKDKKLLPAISHWIACQTTNGTARSTQSIQAALLKHDVEVTLLRTSYKWGSDVLNKLCKVLKDHKNPCMMQLVATSYQHCLRLVKWLFDL